MKHLILKILIFIVSTAICFSLNSASHNVELSFEEKRYYQERIEETAREIDSIKIVKHTQLMLEIQKKLVEVEIQQFIEKLASRESSGDWKVVNRFGYVGKYQFGMAARKTVGAPHFTAKQFIKNPYIWPEKEQDLAVRKLMKSNYKYLNRFFSKPGDELDLFINKTFTLRDRSKVKITTGGLLAASHLVGPKSVRKFLNTKGRIDKSDGNGTKCSDYMKHFDNYNFVL